MPKLFANPDCPYVQRVLVARDLLSLGDDSLPIVWMEFSAPPQEMVDINPDWTVPLLKISPESALNDSLQIVEYLDATYARRNTLLGSTPEQQAQSRLVAYALCRGFLTPLKAVVYAFGHLPRSVTDGMTEGFFILNHWLGRARSPFLGGKEPGFADVALSSFVAKYLVALSLDERVPRPDAPLLAYMRRLCEHDAVQKHCSEERVRKAMEQMFLAPGSLRSPPPQGAFSEQDILSCLEFLNENPARVFDWKEAHEGLVATLRTPQPGQAALLGQCLEAVATLLGERHSISFSESGRLEFRIPDKRSSAALHLARQAEEFAREWPSFGTPHVSRFL